MKPCSLRIYDELHTSCNKEYGHQVKNNVTGEGSE